MRSHSYLHTTSIHTHMHTYMHTYMHARTVPCQFMSPSRNPNERAARVRVRVTVEPAIQGNQVGRNEELAVDIGTLGLWLRGKNRVGSHKLGRTPQLVCVNLHEDTLTLHVLQRGVHHQRLVRPHGAFTGSDDEHTIRVAVTQEVEVPASRKGVAQVSETARDANASRTCATEHKPPTHSVVPSTDRPRR